MTPLIKTFINALVAGLLGGSVPIVAGEDWSNILISGLIAVIIALLNLWQHRPDVITEKEVAVKK